MKILVVEDDKEISGILKNLLEDNGYEVEQAYNGKEALEKVEGKSLILLDLMMPYMGGDTFLTELRKSSQIPVIVVSAKSMKETKLEVLRLGADDYIIKPFDLDEVLVRVEVVLRRSGMMNGDGSDISGESGSVNGAVLEYGNIKYYVSDSRVVVFDRIKTNDSDNQTENQMMMEKEIKLTSKELQLLKMLLENPKRTFTKAALYEAVWNDIYYYEDNTINVHISNLRSKLKKATGVDYVETVWGIGYRLNEL